LIPLAIVSVATLMFLHAFYSAYSNGGSVMINVNNYGEGAFEAWFWLPLTLASLAYVWWKIVEEIKRKGGFSE